MNARHRYLLECALDNALTAAESAELQQLLHANPSLARRLNAERALHRLGREASAGSFEPGFTARTLQRLEAQMDAQPDAPDPVPWTTLARDLETLVRRFGAVPASAVLGLALYNAYASTYAALDGTLAERLFGLPPVALETLLGL